MSDPGHYRTKEEVEEWKKRDPVSCGARSSSSRRGVDEKDDLTRIEDEGQGGDRGGGEVRRARARELASEQLSQFTYKE